MRKHPELFPRPCSLSALHATAEPASGSTRIAPARVALARVDSDQDQDSQDGQRLIVPFAADPLASSPPPSPVWLMDRLRSPTPTARVRRREYSSLLPPTPHAWLAGNAAVIEPLEISNRWRSIGLIGVEDNSLGRSRDISSLSLADDVDHHAHEHDSEGDSAEAARRKSILFDALARSALATSSEESATFTQSPVALAE